MSLVDPATRWWRNPAPLGRLTLAAWILVFLTAIATGWANARYLDGAVWQHWAGADFLVGVEGVSAPVRRVAELSVVVLPWLVFAAFLLDFLSAGRRSRGAAWALASAAGWTASGLGIGGLATGAPLWASVLLVGALALAARPVTLRVLGRREHTRVHGTATTATVTGSDVVEIGGVVRWKVTLRFTDNAGRQRWYATTVPMNEVRRPPDGTRYVLRYDPAHPGRRTAIHVDLRRPQG